MYRIRLLLRAIFALCGLGLAVAVMNDLAKVQTIARLATLFAPDKATGWATMELGGYVVIGAVVVGSLLLVPRPRIAAAVLGVGAVVALGVGSMTIWSNMLLWGTLIGIVALLTLWVRLPRSPIVT